MKGDSPSLHQELAVTMLLKSNWMVKTASLQAKPYPWILMQQGHAALCTKRTVQGEIMNELMQKCHFQPCNGTVPANEHSTFLYWSSLWAEQDAVITPPESSMGVKTTLAPNRRSELNLCWWQGQIRAQIFSQTPEVSYLIHNTSNVSMHGAGDPPCGPTSWYPLKEQIKNHFLLFY